MVDPILEHWDIENIEGLDDKAQKDRDTLFENLRKLDQTIDQRNEKLAIRKARTEAMAIAN